MSNHDLLEKEKALKEAQAKLDKSRGHNQNALSKTKQKFAAAANINNIMAEFRRTGIMPQLKENPGHSQINPSAGLDYHQAISLTRQQQQSSHDGSFQPDIKPQPEYHDISNISKDLAFKP